MCLLARMLSCFCVSLAVCSLVGRSDGWMLTCFLASPTPPAPISPLPRRSLAGPRTWGCPPPPSSAPTRPPGAGGIDRSPAADSWPSPLHSLPRLEAVTRLSLPLVTPGMCPKWHPPNRWFSCWFPLNQPKEWHPQRTHTPMVMVKTMVST